MSDYSARMYAGNDVCMHGYKEGGEQEEFDDSGAFGSTDLSVIWCWVFDVWQTHVFSDSSLKPLNYCVCFLNLFLLIVTGCKLSNLNILLIVLRPVCYSSYCRSLSCLKYKQNKKHKMQIVAILGVEIISLLLYKWKRLRCFLGNNM